MIGRKTTSPASKKIGKPKISAATPRANGARFSPNRPISVSASTCAPPVTSSSRPSITPNATSSATEPMVSAKPYSRTSGISAKSKPTAIAVTTLTSTSETKAWSLSPMIRTRSRATAPAAIRSRVAVP